jgi:hypothetical protein
MKRLIVSRYLLFSAAFAVAAFASVSSMPAFSQALSHEGSALPRYYDAGGEQHWGSWGPAVTEQQAGQPSRPLSLYVKPHASHVRSH